jgi:tryptophan 2,3-dioxygenase
VGFGANGFPRIDFRSFGSRGFHVHTLPCGHRVRDPEQTHYCSYLRLDQLLTLQPGPDEARHPEEHLFVVTHQSFELWFTQLRTDLPRVIAALDAGDAGHAAWLMKRCTDVVRMFSPMMRVLETMTLGGFFAFRHHLVPASGGESGQWHEIELLSGAREPELRRYLEKEPDPDDPTGPLVGMWSERLTELWDAPSVASAAEALFARRGVTGADVYAASHERGEQWDLTLLAEALLDYDEEVRNWRFIHARTAERTIGPDTEGTAHTSGVRYLERMAVHRASFFPFLWQARGELWDRMQPPPPPPAP